MTADREWMRRLCLLDGDPDNAYLAVPFSVTLKCKRAFDVATDRTAIVMVEGRTFAPHPQPHAAHKMLRKIAEQINAPRATTPVNLADVKAWAGEPKWPEWTACTGNVPGGCRSHFCEVCNGEKREWNTQQRGGWFGGLPIDRNLIARTLHAFSPTSALVKIGGPHDPVQFDGAGWRALVMPMDSAEKTAPRFEIGRMGLPLGLGQ